MTKLKTPKGNEKMVLIPFSELTELLEFKDKMQNENTVYIVERGFFNKSIEYVSSDVKFKQISVELQTLKAQEKDLEGEIITLKLKLEYFNSMNLFQFIKKRYFTKKSKPMK